MQKQNAKLTPLVGGEGINSLQATGNNNALFAGTGNDDLAAWGDGNYLDAGDGTNTLYAEGVGNELYAGSGDDTLQATGGSNYLSNVQRTIRMRWRDAANDSDLQFFLARSAA